MPVGNGLPSIEHIVVLMLENRSFDHMLGFLYTDNGNVSPLGQPYEGLNGTESNPASAGSPVRLFMPGADPGEGYMATNAQLFGGAEGATVPSTAPPNVGFVTDFAYTLSWQARQGRAILPRTTASDPL